MTTYAINTSSTANAYQAATLSNTVNVQNQTENAADVSPFFALETGNSSSEPFVKSVMQSLQNLGVNTADVDASSKNEALQSFLQKLYQALTPGSNPPPLPLAQPPLPPPPSIFSESDNAGSSIVESLAPTATKLSGGTNFKYNVDLTEANLGDFLPSVTANIKTALENIGQYIESNITFDLKVFTRDADISTLAEANTTMIAAKTNGKESIDTSFVSDSMYGVELTPSSPDSKLFINTARLNEMSFSGLPTPDKFDLTSILTHEILHGLAFTGAIGNEVGLKTGYDELISTDSGFPMFVGRHAKTVNAGKPIPLSSEASGAGSAYYHVAVPNDLMSESIKKGEVKTISALDVAMLEDMGISVTGVSPNLPPPPKVQNAYVTQASPSDNLRNLANAVKQNSELQTNFDNLVVSLGGSNLQPAVNLQDFFTQLAANVENTDPIQNPGSLLSVSA